MIVIADFKFYGSVSAVIVLSLKNIVNLGFVHSFLMFLNLIFMNFISARSGLGPRLLRSISMVFPASICTPRR